MYSNKHVTATFVTTINFGQENSYFRNHVSTTFTNTIIPFSVSV